MNNIRKLLSLNNKYGKELIEIRHQRQPLRVTIIDEQFVNLKETREPTGRKRELRKKRFFFYTITDTTWIQWCSKIFWKMFHGSIGSAKRLEQIEKIPLLDK